MLSEDLVTSGGKQNVVRLSVACLVMLPSNAALSVLAWSIIGYNAVKDSIRR